MSRRDRAKATARRQAHVAQAAKKTGNPDQERAREQREAIAALAPSAARVLVSGPDGPASVDPVTTALAFARGLISLQGSGSDDARRNAGMVHEAILAGTTVPSGLTLAEALDIAASELPEDAYDGAITLAERLTAAGRAHDAGEVDLYARVAPFGVGRHPAADEVDMVCAAVVPEYDDIDASTRPRLVVVGEDGWLEVWPPAALAATSLGVLTGAPADAVGEGLYRWLDGAEAERIAATGMANLRDLFGGADIAAVVSDAAARAGSDHAKLAGPVMLTMLALPPA